MKTLLLGLLFAAAILAFPAGSVAQSAGDDQYADPFGPTQEQPTDDGEQSPDAQAPDQGVPALPDAPEQLAATPDDAAVVAAAEEEDTLPRTGFDVWMLLVMGWWTLLGGLALRRGLSL